MDTKKRKFKNGQMVTTISLGLRLIVIDATLCLKGWRYELGFPTKSVKVDRRKHHRFFFEEGLKLSSLRADAVLNPE